MLHHHQYKSGRNSDLTHTKTIRSVDDEEENCQTGSGPNCRLSIDETNFVHFFVEKSAQDHLGTKGLRRPDSGNDLFGKCTALGYLLEGLPTIWLGKVCRMEEEGAHCVYLETNLFMTAPVIPMHGRIDDIARASRQHWV